MKNPFSGSCGETARLMSEHVDGELRGLTRWRVARHIMICDVCRPLYGSLVWTVEGLRRLGHRDPPPNPSIVEGVLARIQAEREDQDPPDAQDIRFEPES